MIIAVVGPTGVGKTRLSIALAKKYQGIIINCDAMQVYQGMDIGTAKVKEEEKEGIKHFLFDIVPVTKNYTVFDYQKDVRALLSKYQNQTIIMVGGTGLYLKAALYDYEFLEEDQDSSYDTVSNEELYKMCLEKDANCSIHPNNRRRMVRFLKRSREPKAATPVYDFVIIGLTTDRATLYEKINQRVDFMIKEGLVSEVQAFYPYRHESKALTTAIGYKELFPYIENTSSLEECVEAIKKNSRHYAKRQYTFFRHQLPVHWVSVDFEHFDRTIDTVLDYLSKLNK